MISIVVATVENSDCMTGKWFYGSIISVWMWVHVSFLVSVTSYDYLFLLTVGDTGR
jgi:hypothetical protein